MQIYKQKRKKRAIRNTKYIALREKEHRKSNVGAKPCAKGDNKIFKALILNAIKDWKLQIKIPPR